jgi:hypothetical protein
VNVLYAGRLSTLGVLFTEPPAPTPDPVPEPEPAPRAAATLSTTYELTVLIKDGGGVLTKHIHLDADGKLLSDGSTCVMSRGRARRVRVTGLAALGTLIEQLKQTEALALGALFANLPDSVTITTKDQLRKLGDDTAPPDLVARTASHIGYRAGQPALVLIDFDSKGMSHDVAQKVGDVGGIWNALATMIAPDLADAGRVIRPSTSSGLYRADTGEQLPGSSNAHIYLLVKDGTDAERFLRDLHARCWLAGFGWMMVGAGGQMLERSIIDRMVGAPERLVFEGPPVITPPVAQDAAARVPVVVEGDVLDTIAACRPLTLVEQAELKSLRASERQRLAVEAKRVREAYVAERARELAKRTGVPEQQAVRIIESQCNGTLLPNVVLPFDDPKLAGKAVGDVLADPDRYVGETLADPLEGVDYGIGKAKIMQRTDGSLWINSFAHGRTTYELKLDAAGAKKLLQAEPVDTLVAKYLRVVTTAQLDEAETTVLRRLVADRSGADRGDLRKMEQAAIVAAYQQRREERRQRQLAARTDPRPQITVPRHDAEWTPVMNTLNEVLGASKEAEPPMRNVDGVMTAVRQRRIPGLHTLTAAGANAAEAPRDRLPAPEHTLLTRLSVPQVGELVERYIEHIHPKDGEPVHLPSSFVAHYVERPGDPALPVVGAISTLPIVLPGGEILSAPGLNRERGIIFRVPPVILKLLPRIEDCTPHLVLRAYRFLTDTWLCDVTTDATGKAVILSAALSLIERSLLDNRPCYLVGAGRRGGGKTTLLIMLLLAITGMPPSASAWSPNEEERRKALVSYIEAGLAGLVFDNIPRGARLSCAHIEKACTTKWYADRRLGVNELIIVAVATIVFFTGNNIAAVDDLASRTLQILIDVTRPDPENRTFKHPDPLGWTLANRAKILRALYVLLLGNPLLREGNNAPANTRFKDWYRLCGSATEHAATLAGHDLDFRRLFVTQEEEAESAGLPDAIASIIKKWPVGTPFRSQDIVKLINERSAGWTINEQDQEAGVALLEFLYPNAHPLFVANAKSVGKKLVRHVGNTVRVGDHPLRLETWKDSAAGGKDAAWFAVKAPALRQP